MQRDGPHEASAFGFGGRVHRSHRSETLDSTPKRRGVSKLPFRFVVGPFRQVFSDKSRTVRWPESNERAGVGEHPRPSLLSSFLGFWKAYATLWVPMSSAENLPHDRSDNPEGAVGSRHRPLLLDPVLPFRLHATRSHLEIRLPRGS